MITTFEPTLIDLTTIKIVLFNAGFMTVDCGDYILVKLNNRRVSIDEVNTALYQEFEAHIDNGISQTHHGVNIYSD